MLQKHIRSPICHHPQYLRRYLPTYLISNYGPTNGHALKESPKKIARGKPPVSEPTTLPEYDYAYDLKIEWVSLTLIQDFLPEHNSYLREPDAKSRHSHN